MNVFGGKLESAYLSIPVSIHMSIYVQNASNFVSSYCFALIVLKLCTYNNHILQEPVLERQLVLLIEE